MTRNGKIARLPRSLREQLNQRLRDGEVGTHLLQWLNDLPEVRTILKKEFCGRPILAQNLSDWKQGGYEDWLRHQEALAVTQQLQEESRELVDASGESELTEQVSVVAIMALGKSLREILREPATPKQRQELQGLARELILLRRCTQEDWRLEMEIKDWEQKCEDEEVRRYADRLAQEEMLRFRGEQGEATYLKEIKKGPLTPERKKEYWEFFAVTYGPKHPLTLSLRPPDGSQPTGRFKPNQGESSQIKVNQGGKIAAPAP